MSILSFGKFASQKQRAGVADWTNQEMADFFRAHRLLVQNGASIGLDRGLSDIGEPWLVFYDSTTQEVFLHIARIDGTCVLVCEHLSIKIKAATIDLLISRFEEDVRNTFDLRSERSGNVITHPAARIIMSISAVFLLFKLDYSSQTYAKEVVWQGADTARKSDSLHARLQSTMARLFDAAETPVAMAVLAGVILASELTSERGDDNDGDGTELSAALELDQSHESSLALHTSQEAPDGVALGVAPNAVEALDATHTVENARIVALPDITVDVAALAAQFVPASKEFTLEPSQAFAVGPELEFASGTAPTEDAVAEQPPVIGAASTFAPPTATPADRPLAVQFLQDVTTLDFGALINDADTGLLISTTGEITTIALEDTDTDFASFGFQAETRLNSADLTQMLEHIISSIGSYELEINGNALSIVQMADTGADHPNLGMWTNIMNDGSSIAVIGAIDLIDDLSTYLAVA